jgi:hypothetical protein
MFFRICLQGIVNKTFETFGLCVYKVLVCLVLLAASSIPPAKAEPRLDLLLQEFDARPLSVEEQRYLQLGLALTGHYNGTLDGKWGSISQQALTRYAYNVFSLTVPGIRPRNIHAAALYYQVQEILEAQRWKLSYEDRFSISIALPEGVLKVISNEPSEKIYGIAESDFSIKLLRHPETILEDIHGSFRFVFDEEPYQFRGPALWVTGLDLKDGGGIYIRSDLVDGEWTSVIIRAPAESETLLTGIAASISSGRAEPWQKPTSGFLFGLGRLASVSFLNRNNRAIHSKPDHPLKAFYGDPNVKRFLELVSKSKFISGLPEMQSDVDLCEAAVNEDGWVADEPGKVAELQFRGLRVIDCYQLLLATKLPKTDRLTFLWYRHPELKTMDQIDLCVLATQRRNFAPRTFRTDRRSEIYVRAALKRGLDNEDCAILLLKVPRATLLNKEQPPADSLFPKLSNKDLCSQATKIVDGSLEWRGSDESIGVEVKLRSLRVEDCWFLNR